VHAIGAVRALVLNGMLGAISCIGGIVAVRRVA
jgi:hypothetical protein